MGSEGCSRTCSGITLVKPQNSEAPSCLQVGKPARSLGTGSFPNCVGSATCLQGGLRGYQVGKRRTAGTGMRRAYPPSGLFAGSRAVLTCLSPLEPLSARCSGRSAARARACEHVPVCVRVPMHAYVPVRVRLCLCVCACGCPPPTAIPAPEALLSLLALPLFA